jgi:hypothetical protein
VKRSWGNFHLITSFLTNKRREKGEGKRVKRQWTAPFVEIDAVVGANAVQRVATEQGHVHVRRSAMSVATICVTAYALFSFCRLICLCRH